MPVITTIQDLKRLHERRVPRMFYDYAESKTHPTLTRFACANALPST